MKKAKIIGTVIGILVFISLISGLTYAWFTWKSGNTNISGNTGCFNIDYGISQEIGATSKESLKLGEQYSDGLSAKVTLTLSPNCVGITGTGTLYLNTNTAGTDTSILSGALKYTVIKANGTTKTELSSGVITSTDRITLAENIELSETAPNYTYEVWVWIDGNLADNTYANANYSGYISAEATQNAE